VITWCSDLLRMRAARRSTFVTTRCPAIKIPRRPGRVLRAARRHRGPNRFIAPGLGRNCLAASTSAHHGEGSRHARSPEQRSTGRTPTVSWHRDEYAALAWTFIDAARFSMNSSTSGVSVDDVAGRLSRASLRLRGRVGRTEGHSAGGPVLWFGGSTVHDAVARRLASTDRVSIRWVVRRTKSCGLDDALAAEGGAAPRSRWSVASEGVS